MFLGLGNIIPGLKGQFGVSADFSYPVTSWCKDDGSKTPTISGTEGGVFTFTPTDGSSNVLVWENPASPSTTSDDGIINTTSSPAGSYEITYTVQGLSNSVEITITADVSTTFTYPNGENRFTIFPTKADPSISGDFAITTNPGNLSINTTTGAIDLSTATAGQVYTVTFTPTGTPCGNPTTASFTVVQAFESFEFTIQINAGDTFTFPGSGSYNINWGLNNNNNLTNFVGQGNFFGAPAYTGSATSPTYINGGTYTIQVGMYGDTLSRILFNGGVDATKVIDLLKWGEFQCGTFEAAFKGCTNLEMKCTDTPDLSNCTNFNQMFRQCALMTGTVSGTNWNWNFSSNLTTFNSMFFRCSNFNGNISSWNTSMVNYMGSMFDCGGTSSGSFNQDLSSWDVSKVTSLIATFRNQTSFNSDISNWKTDQLVDLSYAFFGATSFNRNINTKSVTYGGSTYPAWKIDKVTTLQKTFEEATSFNTSVSNWDTSSVLNLASTFKNTPFNNPVNTTSVTVAGVGTYNAWNVSSVTNMGDSSSNNGPFSNCTSFNQPLNNWDTGSVQSFYSIFDGCSSFNQDISSWNTSTATSMARMFRNATSFDQDISSWDINQVSNFLQFMLGASLLTANYDALLTAWNAQGAMSYSGTVDFGDSIPSCDNAASNGAFAARASLITKWGGIEDKFTENNTCQPLAGFDYASDEYCTNASPSTVDPTNIGTSASFSYITESYSVAQTFSGLNGQANTGGGGGGGASRLGSSSSISANGGSGGSGIVILKYPTNLNATFSAGLTKSDVVSGSDTITSITAGTGTVTFANSGTLGEYLIVAGGGGGGGSQWYPSFWQSAGAGGGAGGLLTATNLSVSAQSYNITVGAGGAGGLGVIDNSGITRNCGETGTSGQNSIFSSFTAIGGGGGGGATHNGNSGTYACSNGDGLSGGSGGGAGGVVSGNTAARTAGTGTTGQGNSGGGPGSGRSANGGGGAGAAGSGGAINSSPGGDGGIGVISSITGTATYYAGGGGGGGYWQNSVGDGTGGNGGTGGGGAGGTSKP